MMTPTTHGIREGSKAEQPEEEQGKAKGRKVKAEEDEDTSDLEDPKEKEKEKEREEKEEPTWWVKKNMKKNGKSQKTGHYETNDGYWADDQTWHDGYWANEDLYYKDEHGYFQKKGKGKARKARKERMMKEKESQEMAKESQTMRARRGGQNRRDAVAQQHRDEAAQLPVHVGLLVLCTHWNEENGIENSHQHSPHPRFARCCMVHESSEFQNTSSEEMKHDQFEYSQVVVQQDVQHEEALVTGDYWQVDSLRRELIRHHKDKRQYLHEMTRSPAPPFPKDQLLHDRETHIEYQDGKKALHKDNWKAEKKRFPDNLDGDWKGKPV
eukprot:s1108_g7.t1